MVDHMLAMTLSEILACTADEHPERIALLWGDTELTYGELIDRVTRLSGAMRVAGVTPGDRVALIGTPCPGLVEAELAAVACGAVPFSLFHELAWPERQAIMEDADPALIVYAPDEAALAAHATAPSLLTRWSTSDGGDHPDLDRVIANATPLTQPHRADPDETALLVYTGGTSGRPRGVMHSHRGVMAFFGMPRNGRFGSGGRDRRILPNLAHLSGQGNLWLTIAHGDSMVIDGPGPLTAERMVELAERHQCTGVTVTGNQVREVAFLLAEHGVDCVQFLIHGAAPLSASLARSAIEALTDTHLLHVYGQTESGLLVTMLDLTAEWRAGREWRLSSAGSPDFLAHFGQTPPKLRIVDGDRQVLPAGEAGEVECRSDVLMKGYWRNPEATQAVLQGGWLRTGDVGYLDEDNFLYLTDRAKDMVIVGSHNVYCIEVERVLDTHPDVAEAAIIGIPEPGGGEAVLAVVVTRQESDISLHDLRRYCAPHMASYKLPSRLEIVPALPRTPLHKLDKRRLRQRFWAGRERNIG